MSRSSKRVLVACHDVRVAGGLYRFDRVAAVLCRWGHELAFLAFADPLLQSRPTAVPVLTFAEAARHRWDAVMVPGAGFPEETIEKFAELQDERFGVRVQHILNDRKNHARFKAVNDSFSPHVVIFNNEDWPVGSFIQFKADRFHVLLGAVDVKRFQPRPSSSSSPPRGWLVGGLANKNPEPIIEAMEVEAGDFIVHLYGEDHLKLAERYADLVRDGRLKLMGVLCEEALVDFYGRVDCIVMTELSAGWANLAAEGMACGLPVICTRHGTSAFADHERTALVMDQPSAKSIAAYVRRLQEDAALHQRLCRAGREQIAKFPWEAYTETLLSYIKHDGRSHYFHAPDKGLFGKWPLGARASGLQSLLERAGGASVLDLGAAEGLVALLFLEAGARLVHSFELDPQRVAAAKERGRAWPAFRCHAADIADWRHFAREYADVLEDQYDVVLFLGVLQHLAAPARLQTLVGAIRLAREFFAFRAPLATYTSDEIESRLASEGFVRVETDADDDRLDGLGICSIYRRTGPPAS